MYKLARQQSNLKLLPEDSYEISLNQQPNRLELVLNGKQNQVHSTGEVCWKYFCILLWFYFMNPKWTKTKIVIEITVPSGLILSTACTGSLWIPLIIS